MTSLFLIAQEYRAAADKLTELDLDPQTLSDTLEAMSGDLEVKAQALAFVIRNLETTAEAINAFTKQQQERAKAIEARSEGLRRYLAETLTACGIEKVEGPGIRIGWRKSSAVVVDEEGLLPAEFMTAPKPPEPKPDKTKIAAAIKAGTEVPGAHIEQRRNLQIA